MGKDILIIQRFYYSFREGFFDYLAEKGIDFKLINSTTAKGKVKISPEAKNRPFIEKTSYFHQGDSYVIFPFLFFKMIIINPKIIVSEGGQNTINNIQILLYSIIFRKKYIIWDLGKGYANFGNSLLRSFYMKLYIVILKSSTYIYGYNSQSKSYFKSLGIDEDKIIVLNNTVDTRKIKAIKSSLKPAVPEELSETAKKGYTFLMFVGALTRSKNIESLADLIKMLGEKYFLIIVGDGDHAYRKELDSLFIGTNHLFVGYKRSEDLYPYYNLASFSVLPGRGGLSINQSMAYGVPVICNEADGAEKDLVIKDETGFVYHDLNDAYYYIISKTSEDWQKMGETAEKNLFTNHSLEGMMERFIYYSSAR